MNRRPFDHLRWPKEPVTQTVASWLDLAVVLASAVGILCIVLGYIA